ncbi:MAG: quinone-dependent dihydroorotate dehydrogenase [Pseudomonadota bacterium]
MRTALFSLPPESVHRLSIRTIAAYGRLAPRKVPAGSQPRTVMGLRFANPVGLAAGWDKDAEAMAGAARLGFGFLEVGTVTPRPQPGNPRPRMFRLANDGALINRLGFNNGGVERLVERVTAFRQRYADTEVQLGINIGKNKTTPVERAVDDYLAAFTQVAPVADYVTVNLSSPNTPGLRTLQQRDALRGLLLPLKEAQTKLPGKPVPLAVKLAPDLEPAEIDAIAAELLELDVDGLIATNTTLSRPVGPSLYRDEAGGLSGEPLFELSLRTVRAFAERLEGRVPIIGVGGITRADQGQAMLDAGAALLQIYTGFIYQGPRLVRDLARL